MELTVPIAGPTGCGRIHVAATPRLIAIAGDTHRLDLDELRRRIHWDVEQPIASSMFLVAELTVRTFQDAIRQERTTLDDLETSMLDGADVTVGGCLRYRR